MLQMLNNVDLSDPSQANSAIGIVNVLVSPIEETTKFTNKYETSTFLTTTNDPNHVGNAEPTSIFFREIDIYSCILQKIS